MNRRLVLPVLLLVCLALPTFAAKFRIASVSYAINGITKEYAIENAVPISTARIFNSYEELHAYVTDIEQQLQNQRVFDSSIVNLTYDFNTTNDVTLIHLRIFTSDSKHLMIVPYPKYDSNNGATLKFKIKDMNFLGTMSILNSDLSFAMEQEDEESKKDFVVGVNFSYDYPFRLGPFKSSWNNALGINYTFGKKEPEFDISTGLTFELPFDTFSLCLTFTQSFTKDFDYEAYNDKLYFTEDATLSIPITVAKIDGWGNVTWSPYVSYTWNWDRDGINEENSDLSSPTLAVGHNISTSRVNWKGNFREGLSAAAGQSISYNFQKEQYSPTVWGEIMGYKAFDRFGLTGRLYGFASFNSTEKIGSRLRGIRDDQKYDDSEQKALSVPVAIVGNIDIPIHLLTTDWNATFAALFGEDSSIARAFSFMRYFDFELQVSLFGDFALTKNAMTDRIFRIEDGFYAGGLEFLIYPKKWRSIEVRASLGIDAGRKIIKKAVSRLIDTSWRRNVSAYEIYVGIGLHY